MRLLLIPCSKAKRQGGTRHWSSERTAPNKLGPSGHLLWQARAESGSLLNESPGPDLGGGGAPPPLLPATARYYGQIYQAAGIAGWDRDTFRRFSEETFIVSG